MASIHRLYLKREVQPIPEGDPFLGQSMRMQDDVANFVRNHVKGEAREFLFAFFLTKSSECIGWMELAIGGMASVTADNKVLFSSALLCGATSFLVAHNHPGEVAAPSNGDKISAKTIAVAASALNILFVDDLIITSKEVFSLKDWGFFPSEEDVSRMIKNIGK